jgi:hypothetical protein
MQQEKPNGLERAIKCEKPKDEERAMKPGEARKS